MFFILLLSVPALTGLVLSGQQPEKPNLLRVTVNPFTGFDSIFWESSPTPGIDYYVIAIAVRPNPQEPYALLQIGTAAPGAGFFVNTNTTSGVESVGYTVWAVYQKTPDSAFLSLYDEPDSTIFTSAVFDSCLGTITLGWNEYNSWRGHIREYVIYQRLDNGITIATTLPGNTQEFILAGVQENTTYRIFVEAVHDDDRRRSASNMVTLFTDMSRVPDEIYADYATLGDNNTIDLSFTVDPVSELQTYKVLRASIPDGYFDTLATLKTPLKHIVFNDKSPFTNAIYYYKLLAYNNCGKPVAVSNLASTLLMGGSHDNLVISLSWNEYLDWANGVDFYRIYRDIGTREVFSDSIETGQEPFFRDDFSSSINYESPQSSRVCYTVAAFELPDALRPQHSSRSNRICFNLTFDVRMPNAFIPNDAGSVNSTFGPIFSFTPERYELSIYNRSGLKIWTGEGPWDGKINGKEAPAGVYLYLIRISNYSNTVREMDGQVTLVYR